jgi:cyclohexa-1,5-dienecarbonyl-CoA hydratase
VELVAPAADLDSDVDRWFAAHLAPTSAAAIRHGVAAARHGLLAHVRATLPGLERLYLEHLMQTQDAVEGVAAFIERRPPQWSDR